MSLGSDIAAALPDLRAAAESLMWDSCVIKGAGAEPVWNDETGEYDAPADGPTVYAGPCRLRMPRAAGSRVESGEASWAVDDGVLSLPIVGSESVAAGHVAVVSLRDDPLGTVAVTVQATHAQTSSTARRLPVKVVSRDA